MSTVISAENLSEIYRLGQIGTGTFSRDLEVWWATRVRGKGLSKIYKTDHSNCGSIQYNFVVRQISLQGEY